MGGIHGAHHGEGIEIRFVATDPQRQDIPLVEYRELETGVSRTYVKAGADAAALRGPAAHHDAVLRLPQPAGARVPDARPRGRPGADAGPHVAEPAVPQEDGGRDPAGAAYASSAAAAAAIPAALAVVLRVLPSGGVAHARRRHRGGGRGARGHLLAQRVPRARRRRGARTPTTAATRTSPAASAATTASTRPRRARRSPTTASAATIPRPSTRRSPRCSSCSASTSCWRTCRRSDGRAGAPLTDRRGLRAQGNTRFQSSFMLTTVQPLRLRLVERLVELADVRLAVVGPLALGVGVVDEEAEARAAAGGGPLQHLQVAVGVAEGGDRAAADVRLDADRLARPCRR